MMKLIYGNNRRVKAESLRDVVELYALQWMQGNCAQVKSVQLDPYSIHGSILFDFIGAKKLFDSIMRGLMKDEEFLKQFGCILCGTFVVASYTIGKSNSFRARDFCKRHEGCYLELHEKRIGALSDITPKLTDRSRRFFRALAMASLAEFFKPLEESSSIGNPQ